MKSYLGIFLLVTAVVPIAAQTAMPAADATPIRDSSALKPPTGAKVAIVEFADLECPYCAYTAPIVHAALEQYKIPLVHHDFLIQGHRWSRVAAINARYLGEKASPKLAADYRRDVFASQTMISSRDDLQSFTNRWFRTHGQQMPFLIDPTGHCATEVQADCDLAMRMGLRHTPTVFVVSAKEWIEVTRPTELYAAIDRVEADLKVPAIGSRR